MTIKDELGKQERFLQAIDIKKFKDYFLNKYSTNVYVLLTKELDHKLDLEIFSACTLKALHANEDEFKHIKDLSQKCRKRNYIIYLQVMAYMAFKNKHTKTSIALHLKRNHATIINSIRQVENGFFTNEEICINTLNNISKEIEAYVGNIPENIKKSTDTKPSLDAIWNETKSSYII